MALLEKELFEHWMGCLMSRLDRQENILVKLRDPTINIDGERLLDNQDLCQMLLVGKRTLQRYRSSGELPYNRIHNKTLYKESDVQEFIRTHFEEFEERKRKLQQKGMR